MIQRLQNLYLALVLIFSFVSLLSSMGEWYVSGVLVASFGNFGFDTYTREFEACDYSGPYCLGILLILVMFLSLFSIMLFRKRMRQLRLTILSTIFLVGYVACYALMATKYNLSLEMFVQNLHKGEMVVSSMPEFSVPFLAVLPVLSLVLNVLAIIGIRKDEALIRSLDRIR